MLVDSLEAPPTLAEVLTPLFDVAQVIAAKDDNNRRVRIEQLLWRFTVKIEVKPLDPVASKQLTEAAIAENPPRFANERIRERFARHVAHSGGGVPAGILGMVAEAATEAEITPARAAAFSHDAARVYLDMTPLVIVALVVFVALRYVSRGIDSQELFVLSGGGLGVVHGGVIRLRVDAPMILPTHLLAGCVAFGHAPTPGECAAAIACAALPDLDRRTSIEGRALPFVSGPLEYWFGHRGFSHSLVLQASIGLLAWLTPPFGFALAVVFGLLSHTVMDMLRLSPGTVPTGS